jgi:hypothetical protein
LYISRQLVADHIAHLGNAHGNATETERSDEKHSTELKPEGECTPGHGLSHNNAGVVGNCTFLVDCTTEKEKEELAQLAEYCTKQVENDHGGAHHPTQHYALIFMFVALALGAATQHILSRCWPSLPYTAVLLVEGMCIAFIHEATGHGLGTLSFSITMWQTIDPHLLLFTFLPALLFGTSSRTPAT